MFCQDCSKKDQCTTLCEQAESYIDQGSGDWRESPLSVYTHGEELRVYDPVSGRDKLFLTPMEKEILKNFGMGLSQRQIAIKLNISMDSFYVHIHNMRKKTLSLSP